MAGIGPKGPSPIEVDVSEVGATPLLHLRGELDLSNVGEVQATIDQLIAGGPQRIVVDVQKLTFMDSSGIALLISVAERVPSIELRGPSPAIRRLLEITGLAGTLPMTE